MSGEKFLFNPSRSFYWKVIIIYVGFQNSVGIANEISLRFVATDYLMNFINNDVIQKSITYELVLN